ncbi:MAG: hypothetical protein RPR28_06430 [Cycloclasticus sp.]
MNSQPITTWGPNDYAPKEPAEYSRREHCEKLLARVMDGEAVNIYNDSTIAAIDIEMLLSGDERITALTLSATAIDADLLRIGSQIQDRARYMALEYIESILDWRFKNGTQF